MPPDRFRCPICRSILYTVVKVRTASGEWRATTLLECMGCSVVFRDPAKLTAFDPNGFQQAGLGPPDHSKASHSKASHSKASHPQTAVEPPADGKPRR